MTIEYRYLRKAAPVVRDDGKLTGRAWPYNSWTQIGKGPYGFRERINLGAGKKSINDGDIVLLDNHDTRLPLARMSAGTLTMRDGSNGGDWEAKPADTTYAQDVVKNVRAKNYGGCSFGFEVIRDRWTDDEGNPATPMDGTQREILEMKVHEISVCTFPAYAATSVATKEMVRAARGMSPEDEREASAAAYNRNEGTSADDDECDPDGDGDNDCSDTGDTDKDFHGSTKGSSGRAGRDSSQPYGDVTYADPGYQSDGKKRYPLDTKKHVKAAWGYINQAKNAAKYTASQLASIKSKIRAALKKFGVTVSNDEQKLEQWQALADFREMVEGYEPEHGYEDFDEAGILPDGIARSDDINMLARDIKDAKDTKTRLRLIARASEYGVAEMLPDNWEGTGGVKAATSEVTRDMDQIYSLALSMPPTPTALRILDLAQAYLTDDLKEQAERKEEEGDLDKPQELTLKQAQQMLREADERRRKLSA